MTVISIMERIVDFPSKEILLRYFVNYKGIGETKISTHCVSHHWSGHMSVIWPFFHPIFLKFSLSFWITLIYTTFHTWRAGKLVPRGGHVCKYEEFLVRKNLNPLRFSALECSRLSHLVISSSPFSFHFPCVALLMRVEGSLSWLLQQKNSTPIS